MKKSGRKNTKHQLPSNVTRTRGNATLKRFGVKIRFHGFPLRIGSAYCTPEDASKVASVFRKSARIDPHTGSICFTENFGKKYKDIYVNRYLPFTSTKDKVQVVKFLELWLESWKQKCKKKAETGKVDEIANTKTINKSSESILGKHRLNNNNNNTAGREDSTTGGGGTNITTTTKSRKSNSSNHILKSLDKKMKEQNEYTPTMRDTSGMRMMQGVEERKEIEEETLKNDDFHIGNSKISDEDTIITTGKVTKKINSIKREKDVQDMVSMIKTFLGFNGFVQANDEFKKAKDLQEHTWRNDVLETTFSVRSLLQNGFESFTANGGSSQSNSTEEEHDSSSSYVTSDSDSLDNDYLNSEFHGFDNEFDGMSDMHVENLVPNLIEKQEINFYSLITINGIWDSDFMSHGVLEKVDPKTGLIAERKAVDTLHGNEKTGTSAYFAIDLNDFTIGKYKFKLIAKDGFLSQVGESNSVDFDIVKKKSYSNKKARISNFDDSSNRYDHNTDANSNDSDTFNNSSNNDNANGGSNSYNGNNNIEGFFLGSNFKNQLDDDLDMFDIEDGAKTTIYSRAFTHIKNALPHFKVRNQVLTSICILCACVFIPNSSRSTTIKTDPYFRGCFNIIEGLGFTDMSIRACSIFAGEASCNDKISYLSTIAADKGTEMLSYGPNDYFTKVRDPLPYAEMLQYALCFLLPFSNYILMFGYFMDPYKRDRSFYKMGVVITLLEMFLSYQVGYSMIFSLGSFLSILVTIGMEGYVQHSWSRKKYAKYRLEYRACHTLILFTIYMSVRPWVVKYYGITEGLPIVTTAFATISQRMFCQSLPLLVACTKKPPTFNWFPLLFVSTFILSSITAFSIDQFDYTTIFQLWPYYMSTYFVAFCIATVIRYLDIPRIVFYNALISKEKELEGWYF